ncbi:transcription antitermination factor NusB [Siccirubricoccus phaeus]|uniref:transcription antitermination factor NusB n=1 Tax=Siccirubricoccus phaeus TaxID=2595053 RepID=UPI0038B4F185
MPKEGSETPELDRLRAEMAAEGKPEAAKPQARPAAAAPKPAAKGKRPAQAAPASRGRPRTGARLAAVQALYQSEQTGEAAEPVISQFLRHRLGTGAFEDGQVPEADAPLFSAIVRRAAKNGEVLDGIIARHLDEDWPLAKLDPVLRALLRAAAAELWEQKAPPARVVINEYLDIAHGFFGGEEPRFANGVLDAMARALRAEEFAAQHRR